jgi:hypothetical protein
MRTAWLAVGLLMALDHAALSQQLYWGVIGGTNLTPDFPRYDVSTPADVYGNPAGNVQRFPGPRSFILGGLLEFQLTSILPLRRTFCTDPCRASASIRYSRPAAPQ